MIPTAAPPPIPLTWWQRNWKWAVPAGALAALVTVAVFAAGIALAVFGMFKHSDVYAEALSRVRSHPAVVRELGQPIEPGWWVSGTINVTGSAGSADFMTPLSGPTGRGVLYVGAEKRAGNWRFDHLEVAVGGRQDRIDLLQTDR